MESFETAPVIRFYGSGKPIEHDPPDAPQETLAPVAELRLAPPSTSRTPAVIVALAALAGVTAVALATWAFVSVVRVVDDDPPPTTTRRAPASAARPVPAKPSRALALLARPSTQRYRVAGAVGRMTLAVVPGDRGYLVLNGLWRAPRGRVYVAWLAPPAGRTTQRAASFRGGTGLVRLRGRVREGAAVAVTVERAGRTAGPSRTPRLVAIRRP